MYKYILLDLDGTLTNPKVGITKSVQYALSHFGINEPSLDALERFIGPPLLVAFREWYGFSDEMAEEALKKYRERFGTVGLFENEVYPGMKDMLASLKNSGAKLGVATSKPTFYTLKILERYGLSEYFSAICGSSMDEKHSAKKYIIAEALEKLGVKNKSEAVMVGDRKYDIEGAKDCGIDSIGVLYGFASEGELEAAGADFICESVDSLFEFLKNQ